MDSRLFEAAQTGDVGALFDLLKEHPLMLHAVALTSGETPLHVASLAGHVDFVKEVIRLKPEFAKKLNQDGFSPMHLASANGYLEIVRELAKIDASHCRFQGRNRKTPLHLAVINGRIEVIHELLSSCPESVEDLTFGGQTALHIAVINNHFEAFKVVAVGLKRLNKVDQLNRRDDQGNTVLHLAASTKQGEASMKHPITSVVELILGEDTINKAIEINAVNGSSLTALDIVQSFPREVSDCWKIEKLLLSAGAKKATDIQSPASSAAVSCSELPSNHTRTSEPSQFTLDRLCESFRFQRGRDSPSQVRSDLLIITVLIATATFQAGMSPPGGFWQDNNLPVSSNDTNSTTATKPHVAGTSILGTKNVVQYGLILFFNSTGFYMSLFILNLLTWGFPLRLELQICLLGMSVTYYNAMIQQSPPTLTTIFYVYAGALPLSLPFLFFAVRKIHAKWRSASALLPCRSSSTSTMLPLLSFVANGTRQLYSKWRNRHSRTTGRADNV
ncbi:hypothetical protein Sjap_004624 [Stephania japonica]|uniref:PGG domain-containing protein n=1 Tax=Stephania japonica TaxID=461633 RepID=A0AAP0K2K2_9MAGN